MLCFSNNILNNLSAERTKIYQKLRKVCVFDARLLRIFFDPPKKIPNPKLFLAPTENDFQPNPKLLLSPTLIQSQPNPKLLLSLT